MIISIPSSAVTSNAFISVASLVLWYGITITTRVIRDVVIPLVFLTYQLTRIAVATARTFIRDQRGCVDQPVDPLAGLAELLADYQPTRYDRHSEDEPLLPECVLTSPIDHAASLTDVLRDLEAQQDVVLAALKPRRKSRAKSKAKVSICDDGLMLDLSELMVDAAYAKD